MARQASFPSTGPSMMGLALAVILALLAPAIVTAAPEGELTWAVHVSLAPSWFDPAETTGIITPFMFLYALHDALVKPMPGNPMAPSLAESWTVSPDGLSYEFVLRKGVRFHNGDPLTAEDVKFSMERYRGAASGPFKARIAGVDVVDPYRVRFRFKHPWPDFMTFYGTMATGAGWVVPKKYVVIQEQASEMDAKKREAMLHRIQPLIHEKAMVAPIWELAFINGHGPRVAESGLTLITSHAYSAPYEDLKLKGK